MIEFQIVAKAKKIFIRKNTPIPQVLTGFSGFVAKKTR